MKITHIRPYQVLSIPDTFGEEIKFFMPQPQGSGSISTIESILLLKLMRIVNPTFVFEFGTYKGLTTRLLLENLPERDIDLERIFTLDLPSLDGISFQGTDLDVANEAVGFQRKYLTSPKRHLVKQILQDCLEFDSKPFSKKFELIFVDGNHELKYVQCDTKNSLEMLATSPSCIAWHDYGNPDFPELTAYIDNLATQIQIFHVEDTMLAFHLNGHDVYPRISRT